MRFDLSMLIKNDKMTGFTIVELLVVIVIIGILAAITVVSYGNIQNRAQMSKIQSDLTSLNIAIQTARTQTGTVLGAITGNFATANSCVIKASGTDLALLNKTTDTCWTVYLNSLNLISIASGVNVRGLVDPWGRPYWIDENENEGGPAVCTKDEIATYTHPFVTGWYELTGTIHNVPNSAPGC